jgi:chromosomal replication initiation ATPase DnaA
MAREMYYYICRKYLPNEIYSQNVLTKFVNKDHASLIHAIKNHRIHCEREPSYKEVSDWLEKVYVQNYLN